MVPVQVASPVVLPHTVSEEMPSLVIVLVWYNGCTTVPVAHDRSCHINAIPWLITLSFRTIIIIPYGFHASGKLGRITLNS